MKWLQLRDSAVILKYSRVSIRGWDEAREAAGICLLYFLCFSRADHSPLPIPQSHLMLHEMVEPEALPSWVPVSQEEKVPAP